ncbi:imelysin family protein [Bdellovibrio reynosensis]|uniref:Imelysin family protein n=1 Tax=Bdellovibrio reynosensis TaxID=2835041 RepID=A0ABY4CBQ5_9BACT|nr:imelysin family protein [Bdellovibrio reynosensis]UOF00943.1 imelysin family protein [Bdellovibrio reynosensis]
MTAKNLVKVCLAATFLLTGACADFFENNQIKNPKKGTDGTQSNNEQTLPGDFQKPNEGVFTEQKMLINIGTNVMARAVEKFANAVPSLKNSVREYCEALPSGLPTDRLEAQAKKDWERVALAFHEVEAAPMGPLTDNTSALNVVIYSWPLLNTCGVDKKVFENANSAISSETLPYNTRGIGAIEYLLFETSMKSTCNLRAHKEMEIWNARSAEQKRLDRCQWALTLTKDLEGKAAELNNKWSVAKGNFTKNIIDGSRYKTHKEAINALTDAMSNIEKLKDVKLGKPTGRHATCYDEKCAKDVEHIYSGLSLASAEAQLKAFKALFTGSYTKDPAFGIDDLLIQSGRQDVADKMVAALDTAIVSVIKAQAAGSLYSQIEAVDPTLCKASTMTDRKEEICAVHADVREVAFLLKTEVLAALALRAPPTNQGDSD